MKFSPALLLSFVSAEDKKVPPRHPLQRLERLTEFSEELLNDWFSWLPSKDNWVNKFANNAERMERNFNRGNQRCGYYDAENLPHGGPERKRREDDVFRYNREDPSVGTRQITTGFRKWAERYLSACSGQKTYKHQVNRMNKWNDRLQGHLTNRTPTTTSATVSATACAYPAGSTTHEGIMCSFMTLIDYETKSDIDDCIKYCEGKGFNFLSFLLKG